MAVSVYTGINVVMMKYPVHKGENTRNRFNNGLEGRDMECFTRFEYR